LYVAACAGINPHPPQKTQSEIPIFAAILRLNTGCGCEGIRFDPQLIAGNAPEI
jgi:hypothetical protein